MKKLLLGTIVLTVVAALALSSGCMSDSKEVTAQKDQIKQLTERLASLENNVKRLNDEMGEVVMSMGTQSQTGGVSPETIARIEEMSQKLTALETSLGDVAALKSAISESRKQALAAPAASSSGSSSAEARPAAAAPSKPKTAGVMHKVVPGESLTKIAEKYGTTIAAICKENGLPQNATIRAGSSLFVPTAKQ